MMPVTIIAGQARSFQGQHCSGQALTDRSQQTTKTRAFLQAAAGAPQIFVNQDDLGEAQVLGTMRQIVLSLLSFAMVAHLLVGRLAYINVGGPLQMLWPNLLVHDCSFPSRR